MNITLTNNIDAYQTTLERIIAVHAIYNVQRQNLTEFDKNKIKMTINHLCVLAQHMQSVLSYTTQITLSEPQVEALRFSQELIAEACADSNIEALVDKEIERLEAEDEDVAWLPLFQINGMCEVE